MAHHPQTGERLCHHHGACTPSVLRSCGRAFALGSIIKTVINVVSIAVAKRKHGQWLSTLDWRFGLFLAAFSGGFKSILHKDDSLNAVIAASFSLAIADPDDRATLALYAFVRASEFVVRQWAHQGRIPEILTKFEHYDVLLMGLAAREVLYCYVFEPQHLNAGYLRFLQKHGAADLRGLRLLVKANATRDIDLPGLKDYLSKTGGVLHKAIVPNDPIPLSCELIHPGDNCWRHKIIFWLQGLKRSVEVYAPLHGVFSLILFFRSRHIDSTHFIRALRKWAENVGYSTLFLASYCTIAWIAFCIWSRTHRNLALLKAMLIASGLATLFDHKSRRMELALYCVPKALEAQYSRYVSYGRIPRVPYGEFMLFTVAMASTVYCYQKRTDAIRGTVRSLLGWMWGHC